MPGGRGLFGPTPVPTAALTSRRMPRWWRRGVGRAGDGLEGEGLEGVAGEDGDGFAEDDVAGGLAATEVVVVERGEVVVDEGVGVEHLEGCAEIGCAFGDVFTAGDHAGSLHAEDRAEAFASGEGAVAHGAVDGVREGVGRGQEAFESSVGELRAGEEQVLYRGMHLMLMINQRGDVSFWRLEHWMSRSMMRAIAVMR